MTDTKNKPDIKADFSHPLKNQRHEKFCQLYVTNPINLGAIYREAGYETKDLEHGRINSYKLLRMDTVRGRIDHLVNERNKRLGLDGDDVIRGLYMMRDRCAGGEMLLDRQGNPVTEMVLTGDGVEKMCVVWKCDVSGFLKASELLAKHHGVLVERSESIIHNVDVVKLEEEADEEIANLRYGKKMQQKTRQSTTVTNDGTKRIPVSTSNEVDESPTSEYIVHDEAQA